MKRNSWQGKLIFKTIILFLLMVLLVGCDRLESQRSVAAESNQDQVDARVTSLAERKYQTISVGDVDMNVEVVDTPAKTELGLSYRTDIGADGMLFILSRRSIPNFWMKGMLMDLDMVWIDCPEYSADSEDNTQALGNCTVADITRNVPAPDDPDDLRSLPTYQPKSPAQFVLEVPAGWTRENQIEIGNEATLN